MIPAICLLGFLGSILLLNFADKVNPANRYLGYHFFLNSLFGIAHWATVVSDSDTLRAIFAIHYFPFYMLNTPFLYFYVRAVLTPKIHIRKWDFIHFIPFVLVLINILPFSLESWAFKLNFAYQFHQKFSTIYQIHFPLVPFTIYFVLRSIFSLIYILMSGLIVLDSIKRGILVQSVVLKRWLIVSLSLGAVFNFALIVLSFDSLLHNNFVLLLNEDGRGRTIATVIMSALTVSIYFFPKILYGLHFEKESSLADIIKLNQEITSIAKTPELSQVRIKQLESAFKSYLKEKKYLTPGFSLADLVKDLEIPEHVLTYYFNNHLGITFLKWKNQLRIAEAIGLLKGGNANKNTLESIGRSCGYRSRSNFIQSFKSYTGESPSSFLKKLS